MLPLLLEDLFYGEAVYLILLVYIVFVLGLQFKWKESGAITIPICLLVGLTYVDQDLGYPALIMFCLSILVMLLMANQFKRG